MKPFGKVGGNTLLYDRKLGCGAQQRGHRSDAAIGDSTRNNGGEGREIHADIQREAVHGDTVGDPHADGRDFRRVIAADPYTREPLTPMGSDAPLGQRVDQHSFQPADIGLRSCAVICEAEDGVSDRLPRSVIGDRSTALCAHDRNAGQLQEPGISRPMMILRRAAHRIDGRMFDEKKQIMAAVRGSRGMVGLLQVPGTFIREEGAAE